MAKRLTSCGTVALLMPFACMLGVCSAASHVGSTEYKEALYKSLLFFQGQRSGRLPPDQSMDWRRDSCVSDGSLYHVNLAGGYYDAGDNVKFNFPMAFTATMLSWSVLEYGANMEARSHSEALVAIRWAVDYLYMCATATPGKIYAGVGSGDKDHQCWGRPEDIERRDGSARDVYFISAQNPGTEVAGEMAAALAAAAIVFRNSDSSYSRKLSTAAARVMDFANDYRGSGTGGSPFYSSYSGYDDELRWGAAWVYKATGDEKYLNILNSVSDSSADAFSWDNKFAGVNVLMSRNFFMQTGGQALESYKQKAEEFMCKILPNSPTSSTTYTPGGLMFKYAGSNLQYTTAISFLLATYSKYMKKKSATFTCGGNMNVSPDTLAGVAQRQLDYILGDNPKHMSYMVGQGQNFPRNIHHRGSSLPSVKAQPEVIPCDAGQKFFDAKLVNPNLLTGAIVGGPGSDDSFVDDRHDYGKLEPATYINAAFVGLAAYFA